MQTRLAPLIATALFAACTDEPTLDPIDEAFLPGDDKSDAFGIRHGSVQAFAILQGANYASFEELRDRVKMHASAASAIASHRLGPDSRPGTADDESFETLRELAADTRRRVRRGARERR